MRNIKTLTNILLIFFTGIYSGFAISQDNEKTAWGEIPLSITKILDEESNGQASSITVHNKCFGDISKETKKNITLEGIKRIEDNIEDRHIMSALKYSDDSLNQKIKVFNAVYNDKSCEQIGGLVILATSTKYLQEHEIDKQ